MSTPDIKFGSLITELVLTYPTPATASGCSPEFAGGLAAIFGDPSIAPINAGVVSESMELYIRAMLESCAHTVKIPALSDITYLQPQRIKSMLSPSFRKRFVVLDRRHSAWNNIVEYLKIVALELKELPFEDARWKELGKLDELCWNSYLLILAAREMSDVLIDPEYVVSLIDQIPNCHLSGESKARLSVLRGIFSLYRNHTSVPGLHCVARSGIRLRDRLDEIMEDAYLLEASSLRRFLGIGSNIASIKRDLRRLTKFIVGNRSWAKDVVETLDKRLPLPVAPKEICSMVTAVLPSLRCAESAPLLVSNFDLKGSKVLSAARCMQSPQIRVQFGSDYLPSKS